MVLSRRRRLAGRVGIAAGRADRLMLNLIALQAGAPMSVFLADEARDNPDACSRICSTMRSPASSEGKVSFARGRRERPTRGMGI